MKKVILLLISVFLITGCGKDTNTPKEAIENYFSKYQNLDTSINEIINRMLEKEKVADDYRRDYKNLFEKQYQTLSYKIVKEEIDKDKATVEVEVEVLDYNDTNEKSKEYFGTHQEEFIKEKVEPSKIENLKEFIEYKIKELTKTKSKIKYSLTFKLSKKDKEWVVDDLTETDLLKIHGLY